MVHTDLVRTGWFQCSERRINDLHEAAVLSFRGNACEIPTDCPHRERSGWTGDWQLFAPTAAFLYDVAGFSDRWLRDLASDQWPDGRVTNHVPDPGGPVGHQHPVSQFLTGSAGWGDAATLVPQTMWRVYADQELLERQYDSMVAWVEFGLRRAGAGRHPSRIAARSEPGPHEHLLWDTGFHWGEWCEPDVDGSAVFTGELDQAHVATAYLARSLTVLAETASVLGRSGDADRYGALGAEVRTAWATEFVDAAGRVHPRTQANLTRALAFDLVEDPQRRAIVVDLVDLIKADGYHVGTGFLTTPFLLPTLADHGHLDVAYALLTQTTPPSWLAMIEAGATTMWENWEGTQPDGFGSLNHYSKGAVVTFLHEYVAGIRVREPGYRRFEVRPRPGGGLTSSEARLDSCYGPIRSAWTIDGDRFGLDVSVPSGTTADVVLPDNSRRTVDPGEHRFECTC
jgi:alpha-L-rhamnosidase